MNEAGCDVKFCRRLAGVDTGNVIELRPSLILLRSCFHYD